MKKIWLVMYANKSFTCISVYGAYINADVAIEAMNEAGGVDGGIGSTTPSWTNQMTNQCFSLNGEDFIFETFGDALDALDSDGELEVGYTIYEGEGTKRPASFYFDIDTLCMNMQESAADEGGDYAEDFLDDLSKEQWQELDKLIVNWLDAQNIRVNFWTVKDVKEHQLTQEDIDDYYK